MSGVVTAITAVSIMAAGAGYSIYAGEQARKQQSSAQGDAKNAALKQEKLQEEANNKANAKRPNVNAIMAAAQQSAKGGIGGTMLTGPAGIDPSALQLGKSSLLGS